MLFINVNVIKTRLISQSNFGDAFWEIGTRRLFIVSTLEEFQVHLRWIA